MIFSYQPYQWITAIVVFITTLMALPSFGQIKESKVTPTVISGSLNPVSIAFNGEMVFKSADSVSGLIINNQKITGGADSARSFFIKSTDRAIQIVTLSGAEAAGKTIGTWNLPDLTDLRVQRNGIKIWVENCQQAYFDGQPINCNDGTIVVTPPADPKWYQRFHDLRLTNSQTRMERWLSFVVDAYDPYAPYWQVSLLANQDVFNGILGVQLNLNRIYRNQWIFGVLAESIIDGSKESAEFFEVRAGWQAIKSFIGPESRSWFEIGALFGYQHYWFLHDPDGNNSGQSRSFDFSPLTFYVGTEPLRFGDWRMRFELQYNRRLDPSISNVGLMFGVAYNW